MVAEWIALRHELKQQGKLLQTSQNTLQQAFEALQTEKEHLQQQLKVNQKVAQADQKALWRDLLTVLDALDQACAHWQSKLTHLLHLHYSLNLNPVSTFWQRWIQQVTQSQPDGTVPTASTSLRDVLMSKARS